ncbi:MAG: hypothetical protein CMI54_08725 [Parcubacteria group bacterium]|jgi:DNA-binding PadR family transcriptional regulator|nr:hypothetical protein [Parcubacteria group bacterium]|tara:strand:+ start:2765 stop:3157 length:393 start_codon:yes stop_codon:yes gene_type:complete
MPTSSRFETENKIISPRYCEVLYTIGVRGSHLYAIERDLEKSKTAIGKNLKLLTDDNLLIRSDPVDRRKIYTINWAELWRRMKTFGKTMQHDEPTIYELFRAMEIMEGLQEKRWGPELNKFYDRMMREKQ